MGLKMTYDERYQLVVLHNDRILATLGTPYKINKLTPRFAMLKINRWCNANPELKDAVNFHLMWMELWLLHLQRDLAGDLTTKAAQRAYDRLTKKMGELECAAPHLAWPN